MRTTMTPEEFRIHARVQAHKLVLYYDAGSLSAVDLTSIIGRSAKDGIPAAAARLALETIRNRKGE